MNNVIASVRNWIGKIVGVWERFWFTPTQPHTLAMIRIFAGSMIFYTHLVWSLDLMAFLGPNSWITGDVVREIHASRGSSSFVWSYLWYIDSPAILWALHIAALIVMAMLTLGLYSRVTSVLTFIITVAYCNRLTGALFGLDQVNTMLAMYLMIGHCGGAYSLDRLLSRPRSNSNSSPPTSSIGTNIAIRLMQLHLCVIYLFGGIHKMRGDTWWNGLAIWSAISSYEYQTLDVTWLGYWPVLIALLTHVTVFWEAFYCVLIWHRLTRPVMLLLAVAVHGFIACCMGMITFGVAMLIANLAFISPQLTEKIVSSIFSRSKLK